MVKSISILGSTGSVGRQTAAVAEHIGLPVAALTAQHSISLLEQQARRLHPKFVAGFDEESAKLFKIAVADTDIKVGSGLEGLIEAAAMDASDCVVTGVSGSIGLKPTLAAIDAGKRIALANKETLVCAGEIVMKRAAEKGAEIVPVDSEHSAIFQSLMGRKKGELKKILLTGSGGPFRGRKRAELEDITPEIAVKHPNWNMGAKITIDSASMMNKGLEVIEAHWLFGIPYEQIEVTVHPQSIIHSMVQFIDGSVKAQMGLPDMKLPIQYALSYPDRWPSDFKRIDFANQQPLTFEAPDLDKFKCLALAYEALGKGGNMPAIMNASNEIAVASFLNGKIGFLDIAETIEKTMHQMPFISKPTYDDYVKTDAESRKYAQSIIQ